MKTLLASLVLFTSVPAFAGPDFVASSPRPRELAASTSTRELMPEDDLVFAFNSATLTDTELAQVDSAARWLRTHRGERIVLEGYADHTGDALYNEDLATRRANAVRAQLLARGVSSDRIVVAVFGESGADPRGNALDRRVILHASGLPVPAIVEAWVHQKQALSAAWTQRNTLFIERRGIRGGVASR